MKLKKKNMKLRLVTYGLSLLTAGVALFSSTTNAQAADPASAKASAGQSKKPNILVLWGDDIGIENISYNNRGMMGYQTPNIDRIAKEGVGFTDYYGQQSCTAGGPPSSAASYPCATA